MKDFDLMKCPLRGSGLIEASAGTGKTHAIAGLYLRLILEGGFTVSEILVVTFTVAASQELRDRIRNRLREALRVLSGDGEVNSDDEFMNAIVSGYRKNADAIERLQNAMKRFDEAAIYTIHSFCQQVLIENAFESGSYFDTRLIADQGELLQEIVDDFWRIHFYKASDIIIHYVLSEFSTDYFLGLLKKRSIDPSFEILPCPGKSDDTIVEGSLEALRIAYEHLSHEWPGVRSEIENIILNDRGLNRRNYQKRWIPQWLEKMDSFVSAGNPLDAFPQLVKFTTQNIRESMKEGMQPPAHAFFDICEALQKRRDESTSLIEHYMLGLKGEFFDFVEDELKRRKADRNVRSFDDLLVSMHQALSGRGGSELIRATRKRFKAALIDEFQDTDPIQYNIFTTIFGDDSLLYLIGDPKQAIFGFRGADIFSYMKASRRVQHRYTLKTNWRSDPDLIAAVNTIFSRAHHPFVFEDIGFTLAQSAHGSRKELFRGDQRQPPFHFWFIDGRYADNRDGVSINRASAERLISRAVAAEISQLTSGGSKHRAAIGDETLVPGDIAVLVRARRQARMVQEDLRRLSIPSVLHGAESIFASHETLEIQRVLAAIAEPGNETYVRTALTTDIFGMSGDELFHLSEFESRFEDILNSFYRYHTLWAQHGFMFMFRTLMGQEGVRLRLLSLSDGERRLTNLLHIAELLHRTEIEKKLGIEGLIKWLSEMRENPGSEEELRLETDDDAVKLVTIHSSKGLEYPVVFCPFTWSGLSRDTNEFTFHDPNREYNLTLDIGSQNESNWMIAQREELAENIRLLYVAITRARHRCYFVWGKINQTETSAPAYLFHQPACYSPDPVNGVRDRVKSLGYDEMLDEIKELVRASGNTIALSLVYDNAGERYIPHDRIPDEYSYRRFTGRIHRDWVISSYSSLISDRRGDSEQPDYDSIGHTIDRRDRGGGDDIFSFHRGPRAGQCIHEIFEGLDFRLRDPEVLKLVVEKLKKYGFEPEWQYALMGMVKNVLEATLSKERALTLRSVERMDRLNELEFYFPLERLTSSELADIFSEFGIGDVTRGFSRRIRELSFRSVGGYVRGFIDMAFRYDDRYHIIDWKSNYLGEAVEDYSREAIQSAMEEHYYILQYHLYAVALHRYLAMRLPDYDYRTHFGDVYYIFVRGVDHRIPPFGIYRDVPSPDLIEALSEYLGGIQEKTV
jgi:exodeoxyribonuclease V beta subunit